MRIKITKHAISRMLERIGTVLDESELIHIIKTSKLVRKPKKDGDWGKCICNYGKKKISIKPAALRNMHGQMGMTLTIYIKKLKVTLLLCLHFFSFEVGNLLIK